MNAAEMILPKPKSIRENSNAVCCPVGGKIDWIETADENSLAAELIRCALVKAGERSLPVISRTNIGTRNRISLQISDSLPAEGYRILTGSDTVTITGGSPAGVFYGAVTLIQMIACSAHSGGNSLTLPAVEIEDSPRFQWRGLMLDSARHFQPKETIFALLERMAEYKLNIFHWHFVDRQGWRPVFNCAPELAGALPPDRCYSAGTYSRADLEEIRDYAAERFIRVIPELEMPGHSAAVFRVHPDLACPLEPDPYAVDAWEFCLGNPDGARLLKKILTEIAEIFPDSNVLHIGGDEAGTARWHQCPRCQKTIQEKGLADERALEHDFMCKMAEFTRSLGRIPMTWGNPEGAGFSGGMIVQDWLGGGGALRAIQNGNKLVNSFHCCNYFDYPTGDSEPAEDWQKKTYDFEPVPEGASPEQTSLVLGGEGCVWTEQIPAQRVLPRAVPRLRALAEMLWCDPAQKDFGDFLLRERLLIASGLFPFC